MYILFPTCYLMTYSDTMSTGHLAASLSESAVGALGEDRWAAVETQGLNSFALMDVKCPICSN